MVIDLDRGPAGTTSAGGRRTRYDLLAVLVLVLASVGGSAPAAYVGRLWPVLAGDGRGVTASLLTATALCTQRVITADDVVRRVRAGGPRSSHRPR